MDEERQLQLSDQAKALMSSDVAQEAWARAEAAYLSRWRAGKTVEEREAAYHGLSALEELKRQFQALQDAQPMIRAKRRARGAA